jgi:hypothetical protein
MFPFLAPHTDVDRFAPILTDEQAKALGIDENQVNKDYRGEFVTKGMWSIPVSYTALVIRATPEGLVVYGNKEATIPDPEDNVGGSLYVLVAAIGKRKVRAFTTSKMVQYNGRLYNFAAIHLTDASWKLVEKMTKRTLAK